MTDSEDALSLKQKGNQAFKDHDWLNSVHFYTKAIEANDQDPSFYANRAQANIKLEAYGYAIADATKAIELDGSYVKAYWRRAIANTAILNSREALKDFKVVIRKEPSNKDAKLKLAECEKIVKRVEFLRAIEVGDPPSAFEGLDIDSVPVEPSYDGLKLGTEMTSDFIDDMITRFKNGKKLHKKYVYQIVAAVKNIVYEEPTMVEMDVKEGHKLTVCGDTHGQFFDLLEIFRLNGFPSESQYYLFNGDFVDRGSWSTEIALLLYAYKWLRPNAFFLNRGNHETDDMNRVYGFEGECKAKYSERVFKLFSESFSALPLATLIGKKFFTLHGGLFSDDKTTLDDVRKLNRHQQRQPGQQGLMMEMLWTDPQTAPGRGPSKRGVGLQFGPDVTKRFCEKNGLDAVIRSHEVRMEGYEVEHDGRCITVFSAPKYCDSTENRGAYINIGPELKLEYHQFDAVPHPDIKPMVRASPEFDVLQLMIVAGLRTELPYADDVGSVLPAERPLQLAICVIYALSACSAYIIAISDKALTWMIKPHTLYIRILSSYIHALCQTFLGKRYLTGMSTCKVSSAPSTIQWHCLVSGFEQMTPITRDKAAQPLTLPFNPPCNALAADPSAQGTHHNRAVIPWYSNPNILTLHFEEIDGDSGTSDAKELL